MPAQTDTPVPAGHPSEILGIGTPEDIAALAKLSPGLLPNDALVASLIESHPDDPRWRLFRNDPNYVYVLNWLYQCRGYLKLASEHFDCDLFEIELFELVTPPPVDEMALVLNKVRLALISKVHGKKVLSLAMFETLFRMYFGSDTPLAGPPEPEDGDAPEMETDPAEYPRFDLLFIDEKLLVLALLVAEVSLYAEFREYLDKAGLAADSLRPVAVVKLASREAACGDEYVLLFDGTALYRRSVVAPALRVPKKRKLAPADPAAFYPAAAFDAQSIQYELIYKDVYGLDHFVKFLWSNRRIKLNKAMLDIIGSRAYVANVFAYDLRKRRILSGRKKEFEMARLLATRKRSSRIEAKAREKQLQLEEAERRAQEREDLRYAATRRSQRTREQTKQRQMDYSAGLSRAERLQLRKSASDASGENPESLEVTENPGVVEVTENPEIVEVTENEESANGNGHGNGHSDATAIDVDTDENTDENIEKPDAASGEEAQAESPSSVVEILTDTEP